MKKILSLILSAVLAFGTLTACSEGATSLNRTLVDGVYRTEFEEFDDYGWNLVSYEKFGTSEMEFIFTERDYKQVFFDTAEEARKHNQ